MVLGFLLSCSPWWGSAIPLKLHLASTVDTRHVFYLCIHSTIRSSSTSVRASPTHLHLNEAEDRAASSKSRMRLLRNVRITAPLFGFTPSTLFPAKLSKSSESSKPTESHATPLCIGSILPPVSCLNASSTCCPAYLTNRIYGAGFGQLLRTTHYLARPG